MKRVAVLCPTRDRPEGLDRLVESVRGTSKADVIAYIDEDQAGMYAGHGSGMQFVGERIGPVAAANLIVERLDGYDVYGLMTDDSVVTTPGWDGWLLDAISQFPNRVCVVSPHHNQGNHVDMPFVSREWIKATGWFACPTMYHYAWPTVTSLIGEMTAIVHAPRQCFNIDHDYVDGTYQDRRIKDNTEFYDFVSLKLPAVVESVRAAMS